MYSTHGTLLHTLYILLHSVVHSPPCTLYLKGNFEDWHGLTCCHGNLNLCKRRSASEGTDGRERTGTQVSDSWSSVPPPLPAMSPLFVYLVYFKETKLTQSISTMSFRKTQAIEKSMWTAILQPCFRDHCFQLKDLGSIPSHHTFPQMSLLLAIFIGILTLITKYCSFIHHRHPRGMM